MAARPRVVTLTEAGTGAAHLVTDESMATGLRSGIYPAVCDARVLPASLTAPASGWCQACARWWSCC
ncbi:MAG: hypothetical protein ACRDSP_10830 [Pseudonocardiaceae bacterium]